MFQYIYDNEPGEQKQMEDESLNTPGEYDEAEERTVDIYDNVDNLGGYNVSINTMGVGTQRALHQQPDNIFNQGRTFFRTVTMCLGLLCVLLLAGVIGLGVHCIIKPQTHNKSSDENRKQALVELNHFCKDGCTSFNSSFYYISSKQKSWEDSRQDCKDRGADLVIVNNKEEQVFITSSNRAFWIGLSDREEEGTWKWVDGSVLNSTGYWKRGEPSGKFARVKEDCVTALRFKKQTSWNDDNCAKLQFWICEKVQDFQHYFHPNY